MYFKIKYKKHTCAHYVLIHIKVYVRECVYTHTAKETRSPLYVDQLFLSGLPGAVVDTHAVVGSCVIPLKKNLLPFPAAISCKLLA